MSRRGTREKSVRMPVAHGPSIKDIERAELRARKNPLNWLREMAIIIICALVISSLLRAFLVQVFWIPSASMRNTLIEHDRIAVSRVSQYTGDIQRGDVVVFDDTLGWLSKNDTKSSSPLRKVAEFTGILPAGGEQTLVKRVIGLGGDHVTCCTAEGKIEVNGVAISEPYLASSGPASSMTFDVTVPEGHLWVMGDNRTNSADSRYHMGNGQSPYVPESAVVGRAFAVIWPTNRLTWLGDRSVFSGVPDPQ